MTAQADLFTFPNAPGFKARATSRAAAEGVATKSGPLRDRVLAALKVREGTPEQVALLIGEPLMNCRPRFSELARKGLIVDSGRRGLAMGGRQAIIWAVAR